MALRLAALLPGVLSAALAWADSPGSGGRPASHQFAPDSPPQAAVVLISDREGWTSREADLAEVLRRGGTAVVGLDLPAYLDELSTRTGACVYMTDGLEKLSQQLQRQAGGTEYRQPVVAGVGAGGALALALAAQTPESTISHTLAIDPEAGIALDKPLCTQASRQRDGDLWVYGLEASLGDPVRILFTPAAPAAGRAHAAALQRQHGTIAIADTSDAAATALPRELATLLAPASDPLDMPLAVLETHPTRDMMAVIYSGDGGWRDIDRQVGAALQAEGIPVVGVDSLRYFWQARTPEGTARDLARILRTYRQRWGVSRVLLVGYSFGANILPPTFNRLDPGDRASVAQMSLMAFADHTDFQVSLSGWLGVAGSKDAADPVDDLRPIQPGLVQCIYGTEENDSACPRAAALGAEVIGIVGGHHFDRDYPALAKRIIAGLAKRREAAIPVQEPRP